MKRIFVAAAIAALAAALGCVRTDEVRTIQLRPASAEEPAAGPPPARRDLWDVLTEAAPLAASEHTRYFSAEEAKRCPAIQVATGAGEEATLEPGTAGYAEPGSVTLVVFWSMDIPRAQAAARHVGNLVRKYQRWRVRAVGIVEKTRSAGLSESFAEQYGLPFRLYYDDLSALKRMSRAARAESRTALPSVFIIDRKGRLRFHRADSRYTLTEPAGQFDERLPGREHVGENALPDEHIEDYLTMILQEG